MKSLVIQLWISIFPDFVLESFVGTLNSYSRGWKTPEMNVSRRVESLKKTIEKYFLRPENEAPPKKYFFFGNLSVAGVL